MSASVSPRPSVVERVKTVRRHFWRPVFTWLVRLQAKQAGKGLCVNGWSRVSNSTQLGDDVHFNGMRIQGSGAVTIGDHFHSGRECLIISQTHDYDTGDALPYGRGYVPRPVSIGNNVWLGDRVIVLGGSTIGDGAIIQAGSVVVGDIAPMGIAGGHPARVFRERDRDHYERLASEQ